MGTILQNLGKRQDGLILFDSFESLNFIIDQAWNTLQGTPTISNSVARDGIFSFAPDSTCPLIENILDTASRYAVVYFYDDASNITGACIPSMILNDGNGNIMGVGVNNTISTNMYCYNIAGTWYPSKVPRSTGWHRFSASPDTGSIVQQIFIDDVSVGANFNPISSFASVQLGCQVNSGDGFGFFDTLQMCVSSQLSVINLADGLGATMISAGMAPQALASSGAATIDMSRIDSPFDGYIVVSKIIQEGGLPAPIPSAPVYQSDILSYSAGDIWFLNQFRFGRRPSTVSIVPTQSRNDTLAVDGPKQSVFFYDTDMVTLTFTDITEESKNNLLSWWTTAKRGEVFSVAVEEDDIYLDFTQKAMNPASLTGALTLAYPPPQNGKILTVQSADGTIKENVIVDFAFYDATLGVWNVQLKAPQVEATAAELQVKSLYYWPFCTATAKMLPVAIGNVKVKRWTIQIQFLETVQDQDFMSFYAGLGI